MPADIHHEYSHLTYNHPYVFTIGWHPTFNNKFKQESTQIDFWTINSGDFERNSIDLIAGDNFRFNSNKQYISLKNEYKQHALKNELFKNSEVESKISKFSELLLKLQADKISSQLSFDNSLLYTLLKDNYKIYVHYFLEQLDDEDEVVFSITNNSELVMNFGGSSKEALDELFGFFYPQLQSDLNSISLNELSA